MRRGLAWLLVLAASLAGALACTISGSAAPPVMVGPSAACLQCHAEEMKAVRASLTHRSQADGCLLCHRPHAGDVEGEGPAGLRARCEDCHAAELTQFSLPFHHPLIAGNAGNAGGITCLSCHPPHGLESGDLGRGPRALREHLRRESCVECHREYGGPYQFEHEGDRNLQCLSCHAPHGSPNRRLLTHGETRMLCMSCHINLEQIHLQNPGAIFRDCLLCHTEVHGSNWNRELFR